MKAIIAGGRNYTLTSSNLFMLDDLRKKYNITEVVSGGASGADSDGEMWAMSNQIPIKKFKAYWKELGKKAGPIINKQMAKYADMLIAFPGGAGTQNMIKEAKKENLVVVDLT